MLVPRDQQQPHLRICPPQGKDKTRGASLQKPLQCWDRSLSEPRSPSMVTKSKAPSVNISFPLQKRGCSRTLTTARASSSRLATMRSYPQTQVGRAQNRLSSSWSTPASSVSKASRRSFSSLSIRDGAGRKEPRD